MNKILIATTNPGKFSEIKEYLSDLPVEFVSLKDVRISVEVEENGTTYEENSQKKALEYSKLSNLPAISDDGGLEIDALGGLPGVNSRYFAGKEGKDEDIIKKMIEVSNNLGDNRKAKFVAVETFAMPDRRFWNSRGDVNLEVAKKPLLKYIKGFPYRSFLIIPEINKYYHESEMNEDEKKIYNHRYKALKLIGRKIKEVLNLN